MSGYGWEPSFGLLGVYFAWALGKDMTTFDNLVRSTLDKLERDFNQKISFDDIREEARPDYQMLKNLFSR